MKGLAAPLRRLLLAALVLAPLAAHADDHVSFGTDWVAEAEYGGFYQAVAAGIYKRHGLDVTIHQGGPSVNQAQLMLNGRLDFDITSNSFLALNFVQEKIPYRAIAATFQKDPSVLIAHPGVGNDSFAELKGKPIMISADVRTSWWNFLRARFGYTDSQIRPYDFNEQPFLANKMAIQQGYLGSEPYSIKKASGITPVVLLVADAGFTGYGELLATSDKLIDTRPDLVQRFVDASAEGWYAYLHGDPAAGNALIKKDNPEMTDDLLAYGRAAMLSHGIVESGSALTEGINSMTDARWAAFFKQTSAEGLYPKTMDVKQAYTLQFVNRKAGMPLKK